jgi:NADPH-dependent curcumin reductase CurA
VNPNQPHLRWVLARRPAATIAEGDLELVPYTPPPLGEDEIRVRNVYLSLDPTQRLWMSDREQYLPPVTVGDVMRGGTLGVVTESRSTRFGPGDLVSLGLGRWETVSTAKARSAVPVTRVPGVPLSASMSVLGGTGLTAYFGITSVGRVQAGETVVITAAAGAVGSVAGQIAKLSGARVIGIAGGPEKCRWLTDELSFDGAIDYRSEDVGAALDRLCPDGIDVDFENVGGEIMESIYVRLREHGRMAVCGQIAAYNDEGAVPGPRDFSRVLMRRLRIEGFVITDYTERGEASKALRGWVSSGAIKWRDHVVPGLENAVEALQLLFAGKNNGKLMVQISEEPS